MSKPTAHKVSDFGRFDVAWIYAPRTREREIVAEVGALKSAQRLGVTVNGVPFYLLTFASGLRLRTRSNGMVNGNIHSFTHSSMTGRSLVVRVSLAGRVFDIREALAI